MSIDTTTRSPSPTTDLPPLHKFFSLKFNFQLEIFPITQWSSIKPASKWVVLALDDLTSVFTSCHLTYFQNGRRKINRNVENLQWNNNCWPSERKSGKFAEFRELHEFYWFVHLILGRQSHLCWRGLDHRLSHAEASEEVETWDFRSSN